MLRLLAQREQGYDDLAALMGLSVEEVRAKVKDALEQLEAEGEPAPPIEPPTPPEPAQPEGPIETAEEPPATDPSEHPSSPPRPKLSLPSDRGVQAAIAAGALALIALVVVLVVGGSGGGSSDSTAASGETPASEGAASPTASEEANLTQAVLSPVNGGDASGRAVFGRIKKNVVLQVQASGLDPSPKGSSYTVWLYKSPQLALRIGSVKVTKTGGIAAQFPLPTELLAYVAGGAFDQIDLSLTEDAAYEAEIAKAKKQNRLPAYTGEDVLRGPITGPAIEAASKEGG